MKSLSIIVLSLVVVINLISYFAPAGQAAISDVQDARTAYIDSQIK